MKGRADSLSHELHEQDSTFHSHAIYVVTFEESDDGTECRL